MRDGMTHTQIAEVLGISRESVRNIERRALWKLKRSGQLDKFICLLEMDVVEYYGEKGRRVKQCE
jgi:DNA-binding XRE family transcriptional regulator